MTLPAHSKMVSFSAALDSALDEFAKDPFKPERFPLIRDHALSRSARAFQAGIIHDFGVVAAPVSRNTAGTSNIAFFCFYRQDVVKEEIPVSRFVARQAELFPGSRSANLDEVIDYLGRYGQQAKGLLPVCINSEYNILDSLFPELICFAPDERTGKLKASVLRRHSRVLAPGDLIITKV